MAEDRPEVVGGAFSCEWIEVAPGDRFVCCVFNKCQFSGTGYAEFDNCQFFGYLLLPSIPRAAFSNCVVKLKG